MAKATAAVLQDIYDAWRAQDLDWLASYLPDDFCHVVYIPTDIHPLGGACHGKTAALADVTLESYDHADWRHAEPTFVERTTYLLGAVAEAATAVVGAVNRFQGFVVDQTRPEASNDEWW